MVKAYLLLGGNLGNRHNTLKDACQLIENKVGSIIMKSSLYETKSWGFEHTNDFLNQVLIVETKLSPKQLLEETQQIEVQLGRNHKTQISASGKPNYEARIIDIDVLFYGNEVVNNPELTIPHKQLQNRMFTLTPLNEIEPNLVHPVLGKTIRQLKDNCIDDLDVKIQLN